MALIKGKQIASITASQVSDLATWLGTNEYQTATDVSTTLADYLTETDAADTYLTITTAGTTYQTLTGMSDYVTTLAADNAETGYAKLTDGLINISNLPAGALERVVVVADQTARFALTTTEVQLGDIVKQTSTGEMFAVIDTAHLDTSAGYTSYNAYSTWATLADKPTSSVADIDAVVGKKSVFGACATKEITIASDGQTSVSTGIMTNGTTSYFTSANYGIKVFLNGFLQQEGAEKDFTKTVTENEIVLTWLDKDGCTLETTDVFTVEYTQLFTYA